MNIVWLDQPEARDRLLTGGKAAQLAQCAGSYRVPPGFVITITAHERWRAAGMEIESRLYEEIVAAYGELARRTGISAPVVAVRSSACAEDAQLASYAGQFQTILNVQGIEAVVAAMIDCWQAAHARSVQTYRTHHDPAASEGMALLVQQQVEADLSAIVFSADPVTSSRDEVVINAHAGPGEHLASGQVTPAAYRVRKADLTILAPQTAPTSEAGVTALRDTQITGLARLVCELEQTMGQPVDIECAYQADQLYLLQCRPITALVALPANEQKASNKPGATPSEGSLRDSEQFAITWDQAADAEATWMRGGEAVRPLQQSLSLRYYQGWARAFRQVKARGGLQARFVNGYEYRSWHFEPQESWADVEQAQQTVAQELPNWWAEEWLPEIQADLARWRAVDLAALPDDELAVHLHDLLNRQLRHWEIHAHMGSVPLGAVQRLVDWYFQRFPAAPESEAYQLVQGQRNVSIDANHNLWQLSNEVNFAVADALQSGAWSRLPAAFLHRFEAHVERFTAGLPEDRHRTAQMILHYAEHETPDPSAVMGQLAAEREDFTAAVRKQLAPDEQPLFEKLLSVALANNPLTEDHNLYLDQQSHAATRRVCDEFGRRLTACGSLEQPQDVDFLHLHELIDWGFGLAEPLRPLVVERQARCREQQRWQAPLFLGKPPAPSTWVDRFSGPALPLAAAAGTLQGVSASAGVARGPARVVRTLDDALGLQAGEVLVCPTTDPRWTPLFALAAALVTDQGGSLAHAAVVAREYRLPAVVGTHSATRQIRTGQRIEVDGLQGVVRWV